MRILHLSSLATAQKQARGGRALQPSCVGRPAILFAFPLFIVVTLTIALALCHPTCPCETGREALARNTPRHLRECDLERRRGRGDAADPSTSAPLRSRTLPDAHLPFHLLPRPVAFAR